MLLKFGVAWCLLIASNVLGFDNKFQDALGDTNDAAKFGVDYDEMVNTNWRYLSHYPSSFQSVEEVQTPSNNDNDEPSGDEPFDSWSIVWYIASFGGLIGFFLVVSCSEWCCRKRIRESQTRRTAISPSTPPPVTSESPPPAYDLFAPPSYDSLNPSSTNEKNEYDIYVVPVHAISSLVDSRDTQQEQLEHPPSYTSISMETSRNTSGST